MWLVAAAVGIAAGSVYVFAQVSREMTLRTPGAIRGVGVSNATSTFLNQSFGVGSLQSSSATPYSNILRSSIESRASNIINRPSEGPSPVSLFSPMQVTPPTGNRFYNPVTVGRVDLSPGWVAYGPSSLASPLLRAASSYLRTLGGKQEVGIAMRLDPLTSLLTGGDDQLSTYMEEGEKAFRSGDYETALERFKLANTIDPKNTECLLSLAHASFAMSRNSYYRASYYLTRAVKFLPELPLAPLRPQGFFASPEQYTQRIEWLDKYLQSHPFDNDAFFVAAYFRWFQQDVEGARFALEKARHGKVNPELMEAIDTFRDGMKASGKISETPEAPTGPESPAGPSSQPAPAAPTESPSAAQDMSAR
jgi:hypothetical protein